MDEATYGECGVGGSPSWKSPGPGDGRGSPERPGASDTQPINRSQSGGQARSRDHTIRIDPNLQQFESASLPTQPQSLENMIPRDDGEPSISYGGTVYSQRESRLASYAIPPTANRKLPQSYQANQHDQQSHATSLTTQQEASPRYGPQTATRFSPPPSTMPRRRSPPLLSFREATSHPQLPQTLLPSITSLTGDTEAAGMPSSRSPVFATAGDALETIPADLKPLPQNLRGDPFRSAKVKTELCRYFSTPKGCIFGDKCNYAHGDHELKFNKLVDLEAANMVDVEVFRCHACVTWVATGACPFDQRCTRLHDPRVSGSEPAWLPHAEVLTNNTKKGREVDKLYHQQYSEVYSCSPIYGFAPKIRWQADDANSNSAWKEFYSFCCNMDSNQPPGQGTRWPLSTQANSVSSQGQGVEITEMHRLSMALMMREQRAAQHYTYFPSHIVCGQLCLVLLTNYFVLEDVQSPGNAPRQEVVQVSKEEASKITESGRGNVIIAREIAFGPVADSGVREVSIWFNINPEDIAPATRQQARRHRRSRHRIAVKQNDEKKLGDDKLISCCSIPPFVCHEPMDEIAYNLITGIQSHRYRVLKYASSSPDERSSRSLTLQEENLRKCFESQRRFWMTWTWPKKIGSSNVGLHTEVPDVEAIYNFVTYGDPGYGEDAIFFGSEPQDRGTEVVSKQSKLATGLVWTSFVMNLQLTSYEGAVALPNEEDKMPTHDPILDSIHRIPVLRSLSLGYSVAPHPHRTIPTLRPQLCSSAPVTISLDVLMREWRMMQRQYEENSSDTKQLTDRHPLVERKPLPYDFGAAAQSWRRQVPKLLQN